ncbi:translation initiation factor eIF-1A [Candidatus Woesearchaeota archaeon]|nr:translation initiation factor eIF-1A [Candidatus Woesearchaeota archaeon]
MSYIKKNNAHTEELSPEEEFRRIKLPRNKEVFGIVDQRLGGSRVSVRCLDGKTRLCRIPGRLKKSLWVREADLVLVEPWELGGDERGDVIYKYRRNQVDLIKKRGFLKELEQEEEF